MASEGAQKVTRDPADGHRDLPGELDGQCPGVGGAYPALTGSVKEHDATAKDAKLAKTPRMYFGVLGDLGVLGGCILVRART
jgi:hypothetical protein